MAAGAPPPGGGVSGMILLFHAASAAHIGTNLALVEAALIGSLIMFADLTNFTKFQMSVNQLAAGSGVSYMYPKFSGTAFGVEAINTVHGGVIIGSKALALTQFVGPEVTLDVAKRVKVAIQLYTSGGNGVLDPSWKWIGIQFKP